MERAAGHGAEKVRSTEEDEDDDPVDRQLKKAGCLEKHHKVQFCIAETRDWRKCQKEVEEFRICIEEYQKQEKNKKL